ncbi:MAG: prolyl oligopeptidase family serine peptidase [Muribaculaceae bacterium]|nr:prolyl oligopeptidase family serine peptidase [Muribaculaceae bacterium]
MQTIPFIKTIISFSTAVVAITPAVSFSQTPAHEFRRDMPVFLDSLKTELTYPLAWGNSPLTDFNEWKESTRERLFEEMLPPPPRAIAYDMKIIGSERRNGYTAYKIEFNLTRYSRVKAYLLIPDGEGPHPGVVALHDHGAHFTIGKEKMVRPFGVDQSVADDADAWADNLYEGRYVGDFLAENGYAVLSTDALMWGERGCAEGSDNTHLASVAGNMLQLGRNLSSWMTYEDAYATEFFASLPEVDAERIGCTGLSMGGYRAWMLAAVSPLIKATVGVCWMTTADAMMHWKLGRHERGGYANNLGGVRNLLDYPHIATLACPNAMMLINGETDKLFKPVAVKECYGIMHDVWHSQHADDKLETHLLPMGHEMPRHVQDLTLNFLRKHL